jgi:hypothetical protein
VGVDLAPGQPVEPFVCEPLRDALEEIVGVTAVVVREGDDVGVDLTERLVSRAREPTRRAQAKELELFVLPHDRLDAVVAVLVDDEYAKVLERLSLERREQPVELVDAVDRRDDQIEERHGAVR